MDTLLHRYQESIKGTIEGFDRIVFKGYLRPISYPAGVQCYFNRHKISNKDYKDWVMQTSNNIIQVAETYTQHLYGSSSS